MKSLILMLSIVSVLGSSCNNSKKLTGMVEQLKAKWMLQSLAGQTDLSSLFNSRMPALEFDTKAMRVTGNAGCNNLNGPISLDGAGQLSFGNLAMTRMACPGNGESLFTSALSKVNRFSINDNLLTLFDGQEQLMTLIRQ
jgi:heat shock protein HslJ